ncbi:TadE/TadG family type IV pilus assembly protein [Paraburkholderia sp. J7]|uniref:TadE/TadG family type IV pilus assembly protein n=1 Tax=Paraburkholderia sp. J7 TaxID=2805438 RepID=UPI002AB65A91|nr:TadE/TadG family type IV pilus assembly protein [Paraburkholderia sp. J7]
MKQAIAGAAHRALVARRRKAVTSGRPARRSPRGERGSTIVEFALVLPMLLMLLFGIAEIGFMLYDKTVITSASRAAARQGVAFGETSTGQPVYLSASAIQSIATGGLSSMLIGLGKATTPTVTVTNCTAANSCTTGTGCTSGNSLTVAVSYTFQGLVLGAAISPLPASFKNALTLTSSTMMSCE